MGDRFKEVNEIDGEPKLETLVKNGVKKSEAVIEKKEKIGEGFYGDIYRADVSLIRRGDEEKLRKLRQQFVIKEFKKGRRLPNMESGKEQAMKLYEALKKAGVNTWPTYRNMEGENAVLMTDGENDGSFLVSTSDTSKSKNEIERKRFDSFTNFENALEDAIENALKAGNEGIGLGGDVWLANFHRLPETKNFFGTKKNPGELKNIFVGDFDNVKPGLDEKYDRNAILLYNLAELESFARTLMAQSVNDGAFWKYTRLIKKICKKAAKKIDLKRYEKIIAEKDRMAAKFEMEY